MSGKSLCYTTVLRPASDIISLEPCSAPRTQRAGTMENPRSDSMFESNLLIKGQYLDVSAVFWLTLGISGGVKRRPM